MSASLSPIELLDLAHSIDAAIGWRWGEAIRKLTAAEVVAMIGNDRRLLDHFAIRGLESLRVKWCLAVALDRQTRGGHA